jgi:hypothetical protein
LTQFKSPKQTAPTGYILGKIIFIESKIASKDDKYPGIGPMNNPLRLADGVEYHLVDIERVSFGTKASELSLQEANSLSLSLLDHFHLSSRSTILDANQRA